MNKCKYCNGIQNKRLIVESKEYEWRGRHYSIAENAYIDRNGNLIVASSTHCTLMQSETKINYCPKCGRRLDKNKEEKRID